MKVQVLGTGCRRCEQLFAAVEEAAAQAGLSIEIEKVERIEEMVALGVRLTPALVVDGKVRSAGRVPAAGEIVSWLMTAALENG